MIEQFEVAPCKHKPAKIVPICLMRFARQQEKMKCIIATQDEEVNAKVRELAGVPFLTFVHGVMTLQAPSTASYQAAEKILSKSIGPTDYEKSVIKQLKRQMFGEPESMPVKKKKRKGPKQPNPLSCLKKKKKPNQASVNNTNTTSDDKPAKKKRKRVRKRKWGKDNSQE